MTTDEMEPTLEDYPPVPAGKVRLAEPGSGAPLASRAILATRGEWTLTEVGRGFEIAGSCLRWTERKYLVARWLNNAIHGRSFADEGEARAYLAALSLPDES